MHMQAADRGLEIKVVSGTDIPPSLAGDPGGQRQVLHNVLDNRLKSSAIGSVTIEVALLDIVDDKAHLGLTVCDTGIGINAAAQADLFEPFTQVDGCGTDSRRS